MFKKSIILGLAALIAVSTGAAVSAQSVTTTANVDAYIAQLNILRDLQEGMTGEEVKMLQTILASQPDIYPEGIVSGYFGPLTTKAVKKYQEKFGIEPAGRVGPKTRAKINELLSFNASETGTTTAAKLIRENKLCVKVPPGHLVAPGWQKKNAVVAAPECQKLPPGIVKILDIRQIGTTTVGTTTVATTTALTISDVTATSTRETRERITWKTNLTSSSLVLYSTTTPISTTTPWRATSRGFTKDHIVNLTGLTASTTYYYVVSSTNRSGVTVTSSQYSFVTAQEED